MRHGPSTSVWPRELTAVRGARPARRVRAYASVCLRPRRPRTDGAATSRSRGARAVVRRPTAQVVRRPCAVGEPRRTPAQATARALHRTAGAQGDRHRSRAAHPRAPWLLDVQRPDARRVEQWLRKRAAEGVVAEQLGLSRPRNVFAQVGSSLPARSTLERLAQFPGANRADGEDPGPHSRETLTGSLLHRLTDCSRCGGRPPLDAVSAQAVPARTEARVDQRLRRAGRASAVVPGKPHRLLWYPSRGCPPPRRTRAAV